jgi:diacylglycerol kinase family enzyme
MRTVPIIINATAGSGQAQAECERLVAIFSSVGVAAQIFAAGSGAELMDTTQRVAADHPPIIVAGGGDGTLNAVASVLVGSNTTLGVLPLGTLNHFAKDLGIPLELDAAARTIAAGHVTSVDVGEVNGRIFINNSSLGLYPQIVRHRDTQQRRLGRGKWPALVWASLSVLRRSPFMNVRLQVDQTPHQYKTTFVFIGNNEYVMEGFNIGQRVRLNAGQLSVYVSHRRGRGALIALALRALFGRLQQASDFQALSAQTLEVETRRARVHVATDGEVTVMDTPLFYRVRPGALRVITPAY